MPCVARSCFMRAHASGGLPSRPAASAGRKSWGGGRESGVGEAAELREGQDMARRLLAADHDEMLLVAIEPGHEHHAGLIEARRGAEDVAQKEGGGGGGGRAVLLVVFFLFWWL